MCFCFSCLFSSPRNRCASCRRAPPAKRAKGYRTNRGCECWDEMITTGIWRLAPVTRGLSQMATEVSHPLMFYCLLYAKRDLKVEGCTSAHLSLLGINANMLPADMRDNLCCGFWSNLKSCKNMFSLREHANITREHMICVHTTRHTCPYKRAHHTHK